MCKIISSNLNLIYVLLIEKWLASTFYHQEESLRPYIKLNSLWLLNSQCETTCLITRTILNTQEIRIEVVKNI